MEQEEKSSNTVNEKDRFEALEEKINQLQKYNMDQSRYNEKQLKNINSVINDNLFVKEFKKNMTIETRRFCDICEKYGSCYHKNLNLADSVGCLVSANNRTFEEINELRKELRRIKTTVEIISSFLATSCVLLFLDAIYTKK